jgi:hypothetical protein
MYTNFMFSAFTSVFNIQFPKMNNLNNKDQVVDIIMVFLKSVALV